MHCCWSGYFLVDSDTNGGIIVLSKTEWFGKYEKCKYWWIPWGCREPNLSFLAVAALFSSLIPIPFIVSNCMWKTLIGMTYADHTDSAEVAGPESSVQLIVFSVVDQETIVSQRRMHGSAAFAKQLKPSCQTVTSIESFIPIISNYLWEREGLNGENVHVLSLLVYSYPPTWMQHL